MVIITFKKNNFLKIPCPIDLGLNNSNVDSFKPKFNWSIIGGYIVSGGLTKHLPMSHIDLPELFSFVKQIDDFKVGLEEFSQTARRFQADPYLDYQIPDLSGELDSVDHPYYLQLSAFRDLLEKQVKLVPFLSPEQVKNLEIELIDLRKEISSFEDDFRAFPFEDIPPSFSSRKVKPDRQKFIIRSYYFEKSYGVFTAEEDYSFADLPFLYEVNSYGDSKRCLTTCRAISSRYNVFYWFLSYNRFFFSTNYSLRSLRNRLSFIKDNLFRKLLKDKRVKFLNSILDNLNNVLTNLLEYDTVKRFERIVLLSEYPTLQSFRNIQVFDFGPTHQLVENVLYQYFRSYTRSFSVSQSNRSYFIDLSKKLRDKDYFVNLKKTKQKAFLFKNFLKEPKLLQGLERFYSYTLGLYNVPFTKYFQKLLLRRYSIYSKLPLAPYSYIYSRIKKRRVFLKDSMLSDIFFRSRHHVFSYLSKTSVHPVKNKIYVKRDFFKLTSIFLKFVNPESKHTEYTRPEYSEYGIFERRMHNLLISQGVLFEYWYFDSQLATPAQINNVMAQNIELHKEVNKFIQYKSIPDVTTAGLPNVKQYFFKIFANFVKNYSDKPIYNFLTFLGESYFSFKCGLTNLVVFSLYGTKFAIKFFFRFSWRLFKLGLKKFKRLPRRSSAFIRLTNIVSVWNSTYVAEESLHDIQGDEEPWDETLPDEEDEGMFYEFDGHDEEDEEVFDTQKLHLSRDLYRRYNFFHGLYDYFDDLEDLEDELVDFIVVDIPHYLNFVINPILDFFLRYPIWAFFDLFTDIYFGMHEYYTQKYDNFLSLKSDAPYRFLRFRQFCLIFMKMLTKFLLGSFFFFFSIINFDYNDMQTLVVYTFDVPFRDIYYISYVMLVFFVALYLFGPLTFREFIRDELGFENLSFLFTSCVFASPELYDPVSRPLKLNKDFSNYHSTGYSKVQFNGYYSEKVYGDWHKQRGYLSASNDTREHLNYDSKEFYLLNHKWVPKQTINDNNVNRRGHFGVPWYLNDRRRLDLHVANPSNWSQNKIVSYDPIDSRDWDKRITRKKRRRLMPYENDVEVQRKFTRTNVTQSGPYDDD